MIQERIEADPGFGARQRCAQTVVDTHAEGDMVAQVTVKPKFVRVRKLLRITICRGKIHSNEVSGGNSYPRDFNVDRRHAPEPMYRTLVTQCFLDNGVDQAAIVAQLLPKLRPRGEQVEHIAHEVRGGLV